MKRFIFAALGALLLSLGSGCGLREGVTQKDQASYLRLTGNTENAFLSIDGKEGIALGKTSYIDKDTNKKVDSGELVHYQVSPGQHRIVVTKNGAQVVDRVVLLGDGIVKEIQVP